MGSIAMRDATVRLWLQEDSSREIYILSSLRDFKLCRCLVRCGLKRCLSATNISMQSLHCYYCPYMKTLMLLPEKSL